MPKRISTRPTDVNQAAFQMVQRSTSEPEPVRQKRKRVDPLVSSVMRQMGRIGGKIGGKASLLTMTPEERRERALRAAKARWEQRKKH